MRKLFIEGFVIFASILASFWVDNYRQKNEEKAILNDSIITLGNEITKNIEYTKEHIYQVKNLKYMTDVILDDYLKITLDKLKRTHDNNPFFHNININGQTTYDKQYDNDGTIMWMFRGFLAWEPADIFFKSMLNSGKLLEIENDKLRTEIESIYTKHEERVNGMTNFTKINSDEIGYWFETKRNKYNSDIDFGDVFLKGRDQALKNLLKDKQAILEGRLVNLEFYLQSLQNVVSIISNEYKSVN
ncbi:MAG: hypothetical protein CMC63_05405 [Flavobacteriaceae bacterium]|mgnify:CR=1 FL=1|nr:hypothetical protein [Flavobacteriaceae bacterium]|tara:strand:+ start:341 stop:1075 length:735 start_codon:yes stop_codon:yes gene_type:complete